MKPTGDGPFPAVVLLHRSFGLVAPNCLSDAQKRFVAWGYVALVVDSDSPPDPNRKQFYTIGGYSFEEQAQDAHMAFHYLAARTGVDAARIAIVGYAWGGSSALTAVSSASVSQFIRPGRFRAVAALGAGSEARHPRSGARCQDLRRAIRRLRGGRRAPRAVAH